MARTIVANFATRRDVETAVEHLVQEHKINRADIFIRSPGEANTTGTKPAGADVESGHPGVSKRDSPNFPGPLKVECGDEQTTLVKSVLERAGGAKIRAD